MKRPLLIIAIFLLLGAVVNVAVAWGCALSCRSLTPAPGDTEWFSPVAEDELESLIERGWQPLEPVARTVSITLAGYDFVGFGFARHRIDQVEHWMHRRSASGGSQWSAFHEDSAGWPLLSMTGVRWDASPTPSRNAPKRWTYEAAVLIPTGAFNTPWDRLLPLRPLWPGFAVNTLFYAAILWLLAGGLFALRRFLRVRRGLCPKCAYPMGESSVCTECGGSLAGRFGSEIGSLSLMGLYSLLAR